MKITQWRTIYTTFTLHTVEEGVQSFSSMLHKSSILWTQENGRV